MDDLNAQDGLNYIDIKALQENLMCNYSLLALGLGTLCCGLSLAEAV